MGTNFRGFNIRGYCCLRKLVLHENFGVYGFIHVYLRVDWEIFVVEKFSTITFKDEDETSEIFSWTNKWTKFISSSGHKEKNKTRRIFNRREIFHQRKITDLHYIVEPHDYSHLYGPNISGCYIEMAVLQRCKCIKSHHLGLEPGGCNNEVAA